MLLKEITLQTKDISFVYDFYHKVLELPVASRDSTGILIAAGKTKLIFEEVTGDTDPFYHFAFNIPSNKIEEALHWLRDRVQLLWMEDYKSYIADFTGWHALSVYFKDPAGNILEFIARSDLHDPAGEPFSSLQIRNVSEIGIVLPIEKFDEEVNYLLQKSKMDYFGKQPPMQHFRVLGDDEGLLIVVPEHRNWYPTNAPGCIFPLTVKFENAGKEGRLDFNLAV
ncbi:MAG TPA: hypothetical protein VFW07_00750 [Parafilimonas sp.]|nr:hypothetical protein [Parafilimonas sp.]